MRPFVIARDIFLVILVLLLISISRKYISWWWAIAWVATYFSVLFAGAIIIRLNFFIKALHHSDRAGRQIALSFDDGPADFSELILNALQEASVPAAFFCIGNRAAAKPEILKRAHEAGHLIGNHSHLHGKSFDWKNRLEMVVEIEKTNNVIHGIIGLKPKLFRPPYGVTNPELSQAVQLTGMTTIGWSLRSLDTVTKRQDKLLQRLIKKTKAGDIILLHDSSAVTAAILTAFIKSCREKGFTFVRLDNFLGIDAYE